MPVPPHTPAQEMPDHYEVLVLIPGFTSQDQVAAEIQHGILMLNGQKGKLTGTGPDEREVRSKCSSGQRPASTVAGSPMMPKIPGFPLCSFLGGGTSGWKLAWNGRVRRCFGAYRWCQDGCIRKRMGDPAGCHAYCKCKAVCSF